MESLEGNTLINLGILGINEGNGHPYSYSSIFNGFDKEALYKYCPFPLIKNYLPIGFEKFGIIENAKISYIWTQDTKVSRNIAKISNIKFVVKNFTDMIGKVDGVIIARDDPENHLMMAEPFIKSKIPVFLDKQLTSSQKDLKSFFKLVGPSGKFMACSPMRYNPDISEKEIKKILTKSPRFIHGVSKVSWLRYGHHIMEGVIKIFGTDILYIKCCVINHDHEQVSIKYRSGLTIHLDFVKNINLPIKFDIYFEDSKSMVFEFNNFYISFKKMLEDFIILIKSNINSIDVSSMIFLSKLVLAGQISKSKNGLPVNPETIEV